MSVGQVTAAVHRGILATNDDYETSFKTCKEAVTGVAC
jgi:hypothetical protein